MVNNKKERAKLPSEITKDTSSKEELFQNEVLRPIIKTQSELIENTVLHQMAIMKVEWNSLDQLQKERQLRSLFSKNQSFKREVIGMIIGQFDLPELRDYFEIKKEVNRRIVQIVANRMVDQLT